MIQSGAFNYINVLGKVADAAWDRNTVISNNIANVDTPGYKRQDIRFEQFLQQQMRNGASLDDAVDNARLDGLTGQAYEDHANCSYRLDKNNVDIDTENAELAKNQMKYYGVLDSITQEFSRIKAVVNSK